MKKLMLIGTIFIAGWTDSHALTTVEIVAKVKPAVVFIEAGNDAQGWTGTGFFMNSTQIVTNSHILHDATGITITGLNGAIYRYDQTIYDDVQEDLAVIQVKQASSHSLAFSSTGPLEGQNIVVIGNPKGVAGIVSLGIISGIRNNEFFFTAPISHGSSGSPIVNEDGDVLGVVKAYGEDAQNLNIAAFPDHIRPAGPQAKLAPILMVDPAPAPAPAPKAAPAYSEEQKVAMLIFKYMNATQNGKPVSLAPYVTSIIAQWYGDKDVPIAQAEKENVDYYRHWPNQSTLFDPNKLQLKKEVIDGITGYWATLPFSYYISNGKETKKGNKIMVAYVVLTTNGAGYRIEAIANK